MVGMTTARRRLSALFLTVIFAVTPNLTPNLTPKKNALKPIKTVYFRLNTNALRTKKKP